MANTLRILLVDDHPDTVRGLSRFLLHAGFPVEGTYGVGMALRILRESGPFDVVIADMGMADGSGIDLVGRIRGGVTETPSTGTQRNVFFILYTYFSEEENFRRHGIDKWVTKPNVLELVGILESLREHERGRS